MPLIKSAIKKMRQDRARTKVNQSKTLVLKKVLKETKASTTQENLSKAFSVLDKAAKKGLIHKNKAARQKAALAKALKPKAEASPKAVKTAKAKTAKKKSAKA